MNRVFERVVAWNSARYDQEYNHELTCNLLGEEFFEWTDAETLVDKLDALCDLIYVAMGAMWKADIDPNNKEFQEHMMQRITAFAQANLVSPMALIAGALFDMANNYLTLEESLTIIINACTAEMQNMGLSSDQCVAALLIVCNANDTKTVSKTASDIKANTDKGPNFVGPEKRLAKLLEDVCR